LSSESFLKDIKEDSNDQESWKAFYLYFKPRIKVYLLFCGVPKSDVDDICHQALLKFLHKSPWALSDWKDLPENPSAILRYLKVIAKNVFLDQVRKGKRTVLSLQEALNGGFENQYWPGLENEALQQTLLSLPEDDRILILKRLLGFSLRDIGESLGITENAAGVRFHRIKEKIKKNLGEM